MLEATWPKFPRDREFYSCQGLRCWLADSCWDGANLQGVTRSDSLARISEASTSAVHLERPDSWRILVVSRQSPGAMMLSTLGTRFV